MAQNITDESTAEYNIQALIEFFVRFPNFQNQKFYNNGESYGDIYVPILTQGIVKYNEYQLILKFQELKLKVQQLEMVALIRVSVLYQDIFFQDIDQTFMEDMASLVKKPIKKSLIIQKNFTDLQQHNVKLYHKRFQLKYWTLIFLQLKLIQCLFQMCDLHS